MSPIVPRLRLLPSCLACVAALLLALASLPGSAGAQEWSVNKAKSRVGFALSADGQPVEGRFDQYKAEIRLDPEDPTYGEFDAAINLASANTGQPQTDAVLISPEWLNASAYPVARFQASSIKAASGGGGYRMTGKLTLKGIAQTVSVPFTVEKDGAEGHLRAELSLSRRAFGIGPAGGSDEMRIVMEFTAKSLDN